MFSAFFIDRPKFAFVISIVITIAGLVSMGALPVALYPELSPPQVQVNAVYPGADAETISDTVAGPIESKINGVEDMIYMSSNSANDGSYILTVSFKVGSDPDINTVNVQNRVSQALSQVPQTPKRHSWPVGQALLQEPQFALSFCVSTQALPHWVVPPGH